MDRIHTLQPYRDERGNEITYGGEREPKVDIRFQKGSDNRLLIDPRADLRSILVIFCGDNGVVRIGPTTTRRAGLRLELRVGHDSEISIEQNVGCAGTTFVSASEGADVRIGRDCMLARGIEIRTDDTHAIYDVPTGRRVNLSQPIDIGEHVWLAKNCVVMGGVTIGDGSVIGFRSIVTSDVPNNCVAVGAPARVVRSDVAWERPETPYKRPDETWPKPGGRSAAYWNLTAGGPAVGGSAGGGSAVGGRRRVVRTRFRLRRLAARARSRARALTRR